MLCALAMADTQRAAQQTNAVQKPSRTSGGIFDNFAAKLNPLNWFGEPDAAAAAAAAAAEVLLDSGCLLGEGSLWCGTLPGVLNGKLLQVDIYGPNRYCAGPCVV